MLTSWQTNPLRSTRLRVIDEVANGLSYYDNTFLAGLPRFYADLEEELAGAGVLLTQGLPSFLRLGSWIGGDRDGNPFVTESVLRAALRAQSGRALNYYLEELHRLGGELSLDSRLVAVSDALAELAARSPDRSANRQHEPYRRAITGIYARLAATARVLDDLEAPQHAVGDAPPYREAAEFLADLSILDTSLVANGSEILAEGRLKGSAPCRRCLRLSSGRARFAPELGRARAYGRRDARTSCNRVSITPLLPSLSACACW